MLITMNTYTDERNGTSDDAAQVQRDMLAAKLLTMVQLTQNGHHGIMGDRWCPYDVIWILKRRIVGGRVEVVPAPNDDGCYTIEIGALKSRFANRRVPPPEFLAIAALDKWLAYPVFLHWTDAVKGSTLRFCAADFTRDVSSERMAHCAGLLASLDHRRTPR